LVLKEVIWAVADYQSTKMSLRQEQALLRWKAVRTHPVVVVVVVVGKEKASHTAGWDMPVDMGGVEGMWLRLMERRVSGNRTGCWMM
jgi:hypothetical protein